jgi:F420 biosynthesis protein FbiB-like protein
LIPTAELHEFLRTRRSVRRFRSEPVPAHILERVLESACRAPSAHNRQPWRFVIVEGAASRTRLAEDMAVDFRRDLARDRLSAEAIEQQVRRSRQRLQAAPVVVLLCMDGSEMDAYPDAARRQAESTMAVQSVAAAALQLQLAAHAEGLGSVWVCSPLFAAAAVSRALELPGTWLPQAMIYLGVPAEIPAERERKPLDSVCIRR